MPGTFLDSLYLLTVVLEQEAELQPTEIMTDTAGYTDTIFGIFHLLGLQFNPRIADIGGARFWRVDRKADYGLLDELNRGEGRHQLARTVFHGKRGELHKRYRKGQEDQLGALGIVVNLVVLWNTIYMDAALDRLRAEGHEVLPADVDRLSPLRFRHINMLGRYAFTLPDTVARGEHGPLCDPGATGIDDA